MITKEFVRSKLGTVLDAFVAESGCTIIYDVDDDGECPYINFNWKSPYGFKASILLYVEEEGFDVSGHLESQLIRQGRRRSWTAPPKTLLQKMRELQQVVDSCTAPPIWPIPVLR